LGTQLPQSGKPVAIFPVLSYPRFMNSRPDLVDPLDRLLARDRAAVAWAITAVENETADARSVLRSIAGRLGRARIVGFTGAPGAGKSTLVGAYIGELRRRGMTVGVVAVDPSSPFSGGAVLGDRVRMTAHSGDAGVFIRSLASRGHLGGLSRTASRAVDVLDAAGFDQVVIETVGAGQNEIEVAEVADCRVVVCAPGLGDDIQAIKAGILEIADVLVVNKADLPQAERTARQFAALVPGVPVLRTVATRADGIVDLADTIAARPRRPATDPLARTRRLIVDQAVADVRRAVDDADLTRLATAVQRGDLDFSTAAKQLLDRAGSHENPSPLRGEG
jgi:LAO/AO transport system kinase